MDGIVVGTAVAIGVSEVGEGVMGVGDGVIEADAVALGVGFNGGITSTLLSICLVGITRSRYVDAIST